MPHRNDEQWMQEALAEAIVARDAGEVPVGAVVVREGAIIARAHNRTVCDKDPTAHAELLAIRAALRVLGQTFFEWVQFLTSFVIVPIAVKMMGIG